MSRRLGLVLAGVLVVAGCDRTPEPQKDPEAKPAPSAAPSGNVPAVPAVLAPGVRLEKAPSGGNVAAVVKKERDAAKAIGRDLVVYVGATWCEPCQRFHKAAQAGLLDEAFPNLTLLEYDVDESREELVAAGYQSQLIPLFVVPREDGRASDKRMEGSVKGEGAVINIAPRLKTILGR